MKNKTPKTPKTPKKYPMSSIKQFRDIVSDIAHTATFVGMGEDNEPIYDNSIKLPTVKFKGTVKLHGTNASVVLDGTNFYPQKKSGPIDTEKDNAGFAYFVSQHPGIRTALEDIQELAFSTKVIVYGEWAGKGINNGVAIAQFQKTFYPYGIKAGYTKNNGEEVMKWISVDKTYAFLSLFVDVDGCEPIMSFPRYEIEVDFNNPKVALETIEKLTLDVEAECPVSKQLGVSGIGEGIVWVGYFDDDRYVFKSKGEKHSKTKVKVLDPEKDAVKQKAILFANDVTPPRLKQIYQETFDTLNGGKGDVRRTGEFLKNLTADVRKEESLKMKELNLEPSDVNGSISTIGRVWFMEKLDEEAGIV